ncbi:MAG: DUF427 domain-containing protein [Anaerolineae bacterium]|jgi:uncharacterized protein (DUF427 family)|nr:DUF427 domain-containing protein [Anaerolineae bacterium]
MQLLITEKNSDQVIASGSEEDNTALILENNWYFAPDQVNMSPLKITDRTYTCPYKGVCFWVDLETPTVRARNIGWIYRNPNSGYEQIKNWIGFYSRETSGTVPTHK